jgi:hypothetical protein
MWRDSRPWQAYHTGRRVSCVSRELRLNRQVVHDNMTIYLQGCEWRNRHFARRFRLTFSFLRRSFVALEALPEAQNAQMQDEAEFASRRASISGFISILAHQQLVVPSSSSASAHSFGLPQSGQIPLGEGE